MQQNRTPIFIRLMGYALVTALVCSRASAQGRTSADAELLLAGSQTVVTASKRAQRVTDAPAAVTVFTDEDIRTMGVTTLIDLLRYAPGVDVFEPNRSQANVSIRGFNSQFANKLLIMIDGRSIYQDYYGGVQWNLTPLLLSQIKRVEIVRGPGSALYGANAFNGVINIITKTPAELAAMPSRAVIRTLFGEQATVFNEMLINGGNAKDWSYALGIGYNTTDGFGEQRPGQVQDSYSVPIFNADVQKQLGRGALRLNYRQSDARADLSSIYFIQGMAVRDESASLTYSDDRSRHPFMIRAFGNFARSKEPSFDHIHFDVYDIEAQQQLNLGKSHSLVYGASYRHASLRAFITGGQRQSQDVRTFYLQDEYRITPRTRLVAGMRLDDNSLFTTNITPRVSLMHRTARNQGLRLSYGTAFRNPTLVDAFYSQTYPIAPGFNGTISGNPNLSPERVESLEAGYRFDLREGHVALNLFHNQVKNVIAFIPTQFAPSPPFPFGTPTLIQAQNVGDARATGLELEADLRLNKNLRGIFNYAYQNVADSMGNVVNFSPRHKINIGLHARMSKTWEAFLGAHYVDAVQFNSFGTVFSIGSYTRVDARLGYNFGSAARPWSLALVATNLFDDKHLEFPVQTSPGSNPEGTPQRRTFYITLSGKF